MSIAEEVAAKADPTHPTSAPTTTPARAETPPGSGTDLDPRRWLVCSVIMAAAFMDLIDVTIVNVGLPVIHNDLGTSFAGLQWITAAYAIAFGSGLISGGRLGDIFGRRLVFLIGVAVFTISSALCGGATGSEMLIAARALQGIGAALMVPQVLSIIHVTFPEHERPKVFGIYGGMVGLATVAGPVLGAVLTSWNVAGLQWRPVFLVNVPVGVVAFLLGLILIRETRAERTLSLDLVGTALVVTAMLAIVYPLTMGRTLGWPLWAFGSMLVGVALLGVFVVYERRLARLGGSPLVDLDLFHIPSFSGGLLAQTFFSVAMGIFFLAWTMYLQVGLGWTVLHAGLTAAPFSAAVGVGAGVSVSALVPRMGHRVPQIGAAKMAIGAGLYGYQMVHSAAPTTWTMLPALVIMGLGMGMIVAPLTDITIAKVPNDSAGSASGLLNTSTQFGMALGLGLVSVSFFTPVDHGLAALRGQVGPSQLAQVYASSLGQAIWWIVGTLVISGLLMTLLPRRRRDAH